MTSVLDLFQDRDLAQKAFSTSPDFLYTEEDVNEITELGSDHVFIENARALEKKVGLEMLDGVVALLYQKMIVYMDNAMRFYRRMWMRYMYELKRTRDFIGQEARMFAFFKGKEVTLYPPPKDGIYPIPSIDKFSWSTLTLLKRLVHLITDDTHISTDAEYADRLQAKIMDMMDAYYNEIPYTKDELEAAILRETTLFEIDVQKSWGRYPPLETKKFEEFFKTEGDLRRYKKMVSAYYTTMIMMAQEMDKLTGLLKILEKKVRDRTNPIGQATEAMATIRRFFVIFIASVPQKLIEKHPTFWNAYQIGSMYATALKNKEVK